MPNSLTTGSSFSISSNDGSAYVILADYEDALADLRRQYPDPSRYIGQKDPYSGKLINSEEEFDFYLRLLHGHLDRPALELLHLLLKHAGTLGIIGTLV